MYCDPRSHDKVRHNRISEIIINETTTEKANVQRRANAPVNYILSLLRMIYDY